MKTEHEADQLEELLLHLKATRGFDFTAYKRSSLTRRIEKRMHDVALSSFSEYTDYLEVHPEEFASLFNTILINVTGFFRDAPAWEYLQREIVPRIIAGKQSDEPIRVWSAACASGEEAYSLAMIFAEALGLEAFKDRVKIYATDVDEEALTTARQAVYGAKQMQDVPDELRTKYFEVAGDRSAFRKDLRRSVIFGRHDLVQDAPISRIDLLVSRNVLMYFNADAQSKVVARFYFALRDGGFLFLGKAETLFTQLQAFVPVELKWRIFTKVARTNSRDRLLLLAQAPEEASQIYANHIRIREAASEADPVAQMVVDAAGVITTLNERMRELFGLSTRDAGRPLQDLELSYRPVELRSLIGQATAERRPVTVHETRLDQPNRETRWLEVQVIPLFDPGNGVLGAKVVFTDITRYRQLQSELEQSKNELETAYEELQSTNEELETTNEELQSTIEELETTNEELQSTNEELETMNEELQSTNEELETVNTEMQQRTDQLNQMNRFREAILESFSFAVIAVDRALNVTAWNEYAQNLWGLRQDEVIGRQLFSLDIGLRVERLADPVRTCLGENRPTQIVLDATNRVGRQIKCEVRCMPMHRIDELPSGVIISMEEVATPPGP